jgi:hypothetical protein
LLEQCWTGHPSLHRRNLCMAELRLTLFQDHCTAF